MLGIAAWYNKPSTLWASGRKFFWGFWNYPGGFALRDNALPAGPADNLITLLGEQRGTGLAFSPSGTFKRQRGRSLSRAGEPVPLVLQIVGVPQHLLNPERFRYCFHSRNPGDDGGDPDRPTHDARLSRATGQGRQVIS